MHALMANLAPILAVEKDKTPLYIAGGLLVAWALVLSMVVGMRNPSFPRGAAGQRAVMAISAVLVVVTVVAAISTSGGSTSKATTAPAASAGAPAASTPTTPSETTTAPAATKTVPAAKAGKQAAPAQSTSLKEAANPEGQLKYTMPTLTAKAGKVTISFENMAPIEHNMTIEQGGKVLGATPTFSGGSKTLTLNLKPGTYTFFCSVPGHRQAGMEGKLVVQ